MRGQIPSDPNFISLIIVETMIPATHPIRAIKRLCDEVLATIAVRGTPAQVAAQVSGRYGQHCDRVCIYMPYAMSDDLLAELIDALHGA